MVGNFVADWVKGRTFDQYPADIQRGIVMHRAIDSFTDAHPLHKHSRSYFVPSYGRFSGIVVDVLYDHFLSMHWNDFVAGNRINYIENAYTVIQRYKTFLPARPKRMLPSMIHHDWIGCYVSLYGLEKVLARMSRRTSLPAFSQDAIVILRKNYEAIDADFMAFFRELIAFVETGNF
jgi:acyl carrier protein phosphodiesterase